MLRPNMSAESGCLQLYIAAEMNVQSQLIKHRRLDAAGAMRLFRVRSIDDLDVIGFVASHHLVAGDPIENRVHDGPLWRRFAPAPFGFALRQLHHLGNAEIAVDLSLHDENTA